MKPLDTIKEMLDGDDLDMYAMLSSTRPAIQYLYDKVVRYEKALKQLSEHACCEACAQLAAKTALKELER